MNCFTHRTQPAIALCKGCAKGLCADCALDSEAGVTCRGPCEELAAISNLALRRYRGTVRTAEQMRWSLVAVTGIIGIVSLGIASGLHYWITSLGMPNGFESVIYVLGGMGALAIIAAVRMSFRLARERSAK